MIIQRVWFQRIENLISQVNQYNPCHSWLRTLVTRVVLIASRDRFLAASTVCSAGSNNHFVVGGGGGGGGGGVPSLVQFDIWPLK
jgi:hypothetical protein